MPKNVAPCVPTLRNKWTHISPFSFDLFSISHEFQTSLSMVIQDPVLLSQCWRMGSGGTFPGWSPASRGPSSPRRRGLSLQQPYFKPFKSYVLLLICSIWTEAAQSVLEADQCLGEILQFLPALEPRHHFWSALCGLTRSMYHHTSSLCWNRVILLSTQLNVSLRLSSSYTTDQLYFSFL